MDLQSISGVALVLVGVVVVLEALLWYRRAVATNKADRGPKGYRGATTVSQDSKGEIIEATKELLAEVMKRNGLVKEEIVAIFFTTTKDLHAEYPAVAARMGGLDGLSMICAQEMDVELNNPLAVQKCIRVLVLAEGADSPKPTYLKGAVKLLETVEAQRRDALGENSQKPTYLDRAAKMLETVEVKRWGVEGDPED